jgi:hypothetical protein
MECKVRSNKLLAWSAKCSSIIQSYHIKALTPVMEFKSELFHPTKIKIEEFTCYEYFLLHAGSFNDFTKYSNFYGRDQTFANLYINVIKI